MLMKEIKKCTTNVWRIIVEVIQETEGIARFKASKHHIWIQAAMDPKKHGWRCSIVSRSKKLTG
jgi:hypothetical protein